MLRLALLIFIAAFSQPACCQTLDTIVNVGTYNLHFKIVKGKGTAVLFESGGGLNSTQWDSITTLIHHAIEATLISYDREGFGRSSMDTNNYNISTEITGLESGLKQLGYSNNNFIIVCHSLGGFYSRLYASRHPGYIKGMIMLDPRIPSYADMIFARTVFNSIDRKQVMPDDVNLYYVLAHMEKNSALVRRVHISNEIPVLDLMSEAGPYTNLADNERFKSDQLKFVKEAHNRNLIIIKGSTHNIPQSRPKLVVDQIISFYKKYAGQ